MESMNYENRCSWNHSDNFVRWAEADSVRVLTV